MKENELFYLNDDELIQKISDDFPCLTDDDKERLYGRIKEELGENCDNSEIDENGVNPYKRHIFQRFFNIAASLLLVSGIAVSTVLIVRNKPKRSDNNILNNYEERENAALALTDSFLSASNIANGYAPIETSDKKLTFFDYDSENKILTKENTIYSPITENSDYSPESVLCLFNYIVTDEYFEILCENGGDFFSRGIDSIIGTEISDYPPTFKEFAGDIFYAERNTKQAVFQDGPHILNKNESDFKVSRNIDCEYVFYIIWNGSEWLINNIERIEK